MARALDREADLQASEDVEAAMELAKSELTAPELEKALHVAEENADRAAWGELGHWVFFVLLGVIVVVAVLQNLRLLLLALVLLSVYSVPVIVAGLSTRWRVTEKDVLIDAIHEHKERVQQIRAGPPLPTLEENIAREREAQAERS